MDWIERFVPLIPTVDTRVLPAPKSVSIVRIPRGDVPAQGEYGRALGLAVVVGDIWRAAHLEPVHLSLSAV
ncbi:uncharacterized protein N7479_005659 [Penicillium vulpinum]|uniref:uncharacterized protein n=1 Tax=Penicillium vulpinum TaxID=29845 RepID=UPI00254714DB|nr:uncharacterized protein N7479_005659 [Penicillium vulpinum]KAJ5958509.1 hypothetical protein N7479_005659 [Penicillium vulpinum]